MELTFSKTLKLAKDAKDMFWFDAAERREMLENIIDCTSDFEVGDYRFIATSEIDEIMTEELGNDDYVLGCFNASFLADVTGIDMDAIEAMQKSDAYEGLGKLVKSLGKLEELQREYVRHDGYGHHFAHYDGNETDFGDYIAFKVN